MRVRVPGLKRLRRTARQARSRLTGGAVVLGYHRVTDDPSDPYGMHVHPRHFAEQLQALRRLGTPVSLMELVRALEAGRELSGWVAVTFDDGYADVLDAAVPLLAKYENPATFFVVTGSLGHTFWWEELRRILETSPVPAAEASVVIDGKAFRLGGGPGRDARHRLLDSLYWRLRALPAAERSAALTAIAEWVGSHEAGNASPRAVTAEQLERLAANPLFDVGSHTVSHPDLSDLSGAEIRDELSDSKRTLEDLLDAPIPGLSYPFGSTTGTLPRLAREAGYRFACTSREDAVRASTDPFGIPRLWPLDVPGRVFEDWLRPWL